ncbi:MAG: type VII toxin-antitoxin system MntA family adenylyltransferase antitoxin [Planctomycetota bacterium]
MSSDRDRAPPSIEREIAEYARGTPDVLATWLFGSRAEGPGTRLSDLDVAFLLDEAPGTDLFERRLALRADLAERLRTDALDVVVLNGAPVGLRFTIVRRGRLLFCRDELARIRFEADARSRWFDMEPFRSVLARGLQRRLAEESFGR